MIHRYGFPGGETGGWIFRALLQKVKFTMLAHFPAHIFSLVAVPRKHEVWKSSCYSSWVKVSLSFRSGA